MKNQNNIPIKIWLVSCIALLISISADAQQSRQTFMEEVAKPTTAKGWIDFKEGNTLNPQTMFTSHKAMFGLSTQDDMQIYRTQTDELGYTHFRYQQYHKGIKIIGAETILHHNGNYLKSMNGYIAEELNVDVTPALRQDAGLLIAKDAVNAELFVWEHPEIVEALSKSSNGQKDFSQPTGELVICRKDWNGDFAQENLVLAYCYRMVVMPMYESKDVYVDAKSGELIFEMPLTTNCNNNTGNTTWYGSKSFNAGFYGWPNNAWLLESHCPGEATMRSLRGDPLILYNYGDADGVWTDADGVNGYNQRAGVTTYYAVHKSYDYFRFTHSRLSYDNGNAQLDAFSEITGGSWLPSAENASWNTVTHHMSFGAGSNSAATDDWNTYDIVGHELTHAMHQWSIGNNYQGEPGALDESFADIFGENIESFAKGTAMPDWLMGNDRGGYIRNMSDPADMSDPDTYLGTNWVMTTSPVDNGGVHTNSGVQNFWFFLLAVGGSGINDNSQAYNVSAIGLSKARDIAYRNMDVYLTTASGYFDAREGSLRAAEDLYGWCSNEMLQVARAWYAVGVATSCPDWNFMVPCGNIPNNMVYRGINTLLTNSSCTTTLATGQNALFSSGPGGVTLNPGFTATAGCGFTAMIDVCNEGAYNLRTAAASEATERESQKQKPEINLSISTVYPNPADDYVVVEFQSMSELKDVRINFTDISGRINEVQVSGKLEAGPFKKVKLDVSQIPAGIYLLFVADTKSRVSSKVVINR